VGGETVKGKTVAIVVLLVLSVGTVLLTSVQPAILGTETVSGFFDIMSSFGGTIVALADPIPGGGGSGGYG
jgi:hypothetical protein